MHLFKTLRDLMPGESAIVTELKANGTMYTRLLDLGFTYGSTVTCLFPSAFNNPRAYWVRGTIIALRNNDADTVLCLAREEEA